MSAALKTPPPVMDGRYVVSRTSVAPGQIAELTIVRTLVAGTTLETLEVPAGSVGVVVGIWSGGAAYEVDFETPVGGLATFQASEIEVM